MAAVGLGLCRAYFLNRGADDGSQCPVSTSGENYLKYIRCALSWGLRDDVLGPASPRSREDIHRARRNVRLSLPEFAHSMRTEEAGIRRWLFLDSSRELCRVPPGLRREHQRRHQRDSLLRI